MTAQSKTITDEKLEFIEKARNVLRGQSLSSPELTNLYQQLEIRDQFAYATEVLLVKIKQDEKAGIQISGKEYQTLAKYIYKDESVH